MDRTTAGPAGLLEKHEGHCGHKAVAGGRVETAAGGWVVAVVHTAGAVGRSEPHSVGEAQSWGGSCLVTMELVPEHGAYALAEDTEGHAGEGHAGRAAVAATEGQDLDKGRFQDHLAGYEPEGQRIHHFVDHCNQLEDHCSHCRAEGKTDCENHRGRPVHLPDLHLERFHRHGAGLARIRAEDIAGGSSMKEVQWAEEEGVGSCTVVECQPSRCRVSICRAKRWGMGNSEG